MSRAIHGNQQAVSPFNLYRRGEVVVIQHVLPRTLECASGVDLPLSNGPDDGGACVKWAGDVTCSGTTPRTTLP